MHKYIIKRLLYLIPILIGVTFIVFAIMHFSPGDPATLLLGEDTTQAEIERVRELMGLNDPFIVQYGRFLWGAVRGNLGNSLSSGLPVSQEIGARLPATMLLAFGSIIVALVIGLVMGILAATKQYSIFDGGSMFFALLGAAMPNFWLGLMMILFFSVYWNNTFGYSLLPSSGYGTFRHLIMPAIVLGTAHAAYITRITRSSMLEVLRQDYIRTARAKGMSERKVVYYHALWNAMIPVITITGLQFGVLLGGSVVTETIFSWPGVGRMLVAGIRTQNYPVVQGSILVFAVLFSLVTLGVDILYAFIDPRIKAKYKS